VAAGHSKGTAADEAEEGGDDVKSVWPLCPGLHTRYNGRYNGLLHEGGIASNRLSAWGGEYVPGPCTHRPSRHGSRGHLKSLAQPLMGREAPRVNPVTGAKS